MFLNRFPDGDDVTSVAKVGQVDQLFKSGLDKSSRFFLIGFQQQQIALT